jgi:hypothetical protein
LTNPNIRNGLPLWFGGDCRCLCHNQKNQNQQFFILNDLLLMRVLCLIVIGLFLFCFFCVFLFFYFVCFDCYWGFLVFFFLFSFNFLVLCLFVYLVLVFLLILILILSKFVIFTPFKIVHCLKFFYCIIHNM